MSRLYYSSFIQHILFIFSVKIMCILIYLDNFCLNMFKLKFQPSELIYTKTLKCKSSLFKAAYKGYLSKKVEAKRLQYYLKKLERNIWPESTYIEVYLSIFLSSQSDLNLISTCMYQLLKIYRYTLVILYVLERIRKLFWQP